MTSDQQEEHHETAAVPTKRKKVETDDKGRRKNAARRARRLAKHNEDAMPVVQAIDGPREVRVVDAPLVSPAPEHGIVGVIRQPYLLRLLVRREIAKMYSASILGLFWSYVQPAMRFGVYYAVFGIVLHAHRTVPNFAIHLFCGIVFTHFFQEVFNGGTRSIWANKQLVQKNRIPREIFPASHVIVGFYHVFPQVLLLGFICAISGFTIDFTGVISLILGIAIITVFGAGCGLLFSALNVYYRDFQNIVGTINQMMHFMVPMMYTYTRIAQFKGSHPWVYQLYMANPVAEAVLLVQRFFWWGVNYKDFGNASHLNADQRAQMSFPGNLVERGVLTLIGCLIFLYFCQRVFSRLESKFPERL